MPRRRREIMAVSPESRARIMEQNARRMSDALEDARRRGLQDERSIDMHVSVYVSALEEAEESELGAKLTDREARKAFASTYTRGVLSGCESRTESVDYAIAYAERVQATCPGPAPKPYVFGEAFEPGSAAMRAGGFSGRSLEYVRNANQAETGFGSSRHRSISHVASTVSEDRLRSESSGQFDGFRSGTTVSHSGASACGPSSSGFGGSSFASPSPAPRMSAIERWDMDMASKYETNKPWHC